MTDKGAFEMNTWQRQGNRVYGNGQSYNCTNIATAKTLQNTLNNYETKIRQNKNYDEIRQKLIILQMDLKVIQEELNNLKKIIEDR